MNHLASASKVWVSKKEKLIILDLEPTNMAQTANLSFFSNLFANKNHDTVPYQEALDFPRERLPFFHQII